MSIGIDCFKAERTDCSDYEVKSIGTSNTDQVGITLSGKSHPLAAGTGLTVSLVPRVRSGSGPN